ncbi:MAG: hypothetical protein QXZ13_00115 [Candidatus Diapherotrites archaeon]
MKQNVISSFKVFNSNYSLADKPERLEALKKYFDYGGVISVLKKEKGWPKLIYPSIFRIDAQIKELTEKRLKFIEKQNEWKKRLSEAKNYHAKHHILKFKEPLYWQHVKRILMDKQYREDAELVGLPAHLASDDRYKPMIKMFLQDSDYRKNLVETVKNSIAYKKDKKLAKYVDVLQGLRAEMSDSMINDISKKIAEIEDQINTLKIIRKWAEE